MKIIAVVNQKGGVGKSTLSQSIADTLAFRGFNVVLLDTDKQQSSSNLIQRRSDCAPELPSPTAYTLSNRFTSDTLRRDFGTADFVVIDGGGGRDTFIDNMTISAISNCDIALVPMDSSIHCIDQTQNTLEIIQQRQAIADGRPLTRTIMMRANPNTKTYQASLEYMAANGLVKLSTDMRNRTAHEGLPAAGLTAIYSRDKKMVKEINDITDEVLRLLKAPLAPKKAG